MVIKRVLKSTTRRPNRERLISWISQVFAERACPSGIFCFWHQTLSPQITNRQTPASRQTSCPVGEAQPRRSKQRRRKTRMKRRRRRGVMRMGTKPRKWQRKTAGWQTEEEEGEIRVGGVGGGWMIKSEELRSCCETMQFCGWQVCEMQKYKVHVNEQRLAGEQVCEWVISCSSPLKGELD